MISLGKLDFMGIFAYSVKSITAYQIEIILTLIDLDDTELFKSNGHTDELVGLNLTKMILSFILAD